MKLKKYENKLITVKKVKIVLLLFLCVLSYGLFFYHSYKVDKSSNNSVEFAFYNGTSELSKMPLKDSDLVFIKADCNNGVIVKWDNENWMPAVYNLQKSKTSCTLYFGSGEDSACLLYPDSAACSYYKQGEGEELLYDTTADKNLRFVGSDPKNYVYFNCEEGKAASSDTCETWRIIGIMNNIEDENGIVGSHLKIIRDNIGTYSWDSSSGVNYSYGVNEWSASDIEKVLNDEYLNRQYNKNYCYKGTGDEYKSCPKWTDIGLRDEARGMIATVKWNTGTFGEDWNNINNSNTKFNAKAVYEAERSDNNGKGVCYLLSGTYCNDSVTRTVTWIGKVGLMYPSDFGYAVGGDVRESCLGKSLYAYSNCRGNDWLNDANNSQWTIMPGTQVSYATNVFAIDSSGYVSNYGAYYDYVVRPVVYLSSAVKIIDGNGEVGDPFVLEM